MKKRILFLSMVMSCLIYTSCTKDSEQDTTSNVTTTDVAATQTVDDAIDDVSLITDNQYEADEYNLTARSTTVYPSILPDCATVSDLGSTTSVRKLTITFGNPNTPTCTFRGRTLKGQIILTRTRGTTSPKTMTVTFNDFYINGNKLEGTSTWTRELVGTGDAAHPKTTFIITGMKLTTADGVYTRDEERIREMTAGFATRTSITDDVYSTHGAFTTKHPNGNSFSSKVEAATPLIHKTACGLQQKPYPVSGILKITKKLHTATINYGTGDCDNLATLSIDGGEAHQITLGGK